MKPGKMLIALLLMLALTVTGLAQTETQRGEDGSITVTQRDETGKMISRIHYDAATDTTLQYVYEYSEKGKILSEYSYDASGNRVEDFAAGKYENLISQGEWHYDVHSDSEIDTSGAFEVTIQELAPLYKKAEEIYRTYGVVPLIADKVSGDNDGAEKCLDYTLIEGCLGWIEKALACYPEGFFKDLTGELCIELVGTGSSAGAFKGGYDYLMIQMDANCYTPGEEYQDDGDFFCYSLHHEIGHMIDSQLGFFWNISPYPLTEELWNSYNPEGFEYSGGYDDEKELEVYSFGDNSEYFIYSYGCTTPGEDRATIFGTAMAYAQGYERSELTGYVKAKLKYFSDCIRANFNSEGWGEVAPWEKALYR